jgi:DMSO/TMAO reductase YedYZ heme-binding membrane subunit
MQKNSYLFWLIMVGIVLLSVYESFFTTTADVILTRLFALVAFFLLCVALSIGPLITFWPARFGAWMEPRRAVGLSAFAFMLAHYFLVLVHRFDFDFLRVFSNIQYWIAAPAIIIFGIMSLASTDYAVRTLGFGKWKSLQRWVYVAFVLTLGHFFLSQTGVLVILEGGNYFLNLAEAMLWLLALITITLQLAGFITTRKKKKIAPVEGVAAAPPSSI